MAEIMTYADDTDQIQEISQHIVISRDKSVYVPEIIRKSIVYRDHNVECLTFDCPRYWSGIDISELNIYVNYIAEGQKKKKEDPGSFLCENVVVDEDNTDIFHFDWRITNNASEFPDKLIFLVCAKSVDSDGNEDVHWNSHLCKDLEVQEGLEASDSIVKKYPDVIESILSKLGKQIELRNSGTAIQYRNAGENTWTDLVQLEDIKGDAAVIIESNFKGSDTTANIIEKTGEAGDKWYSTDEGVYYMLSTSGEWINCGSGENLKKIEDEIDALKGDISQLSEEIDNLMSGGGVVASSVEPAIEDIPKVFFVGTAPTSKAEDELPLTMEYRSKTKTIKSYVTLKVQGDSSAGYPKKNFNIKMFSDEARTEKLKCTFRNWSKTHKYCLKANWIDHTHARNVVNGRLWGQVVKSRSDYENYPTEYKESANSGAVDGFPIKVYINGVYQGIYTWNIRKDGSMFNMDDETGIHSALIADGVNAVTAWRELPTIGNGDWTDELNDTVPDAVKTSFQNAYSFVMNSTDEEFVANIENHFYLSSLIDYYIFIYSILMYGGLAKSQTMFTYNASKYLANIYDMDTTWALYWNGKSYINVETACPEDYEHTAGYNLLYERLVALFPSRIKERYAELRSTVLSDANIINEFERFMDVIPLSLYAEDFAETTANGSFTEIPSKDTNNIQKLRDIIVKRMAYCDEQIPLISGGEVEPDNPEQPDEPDTPDTPEVTLTSISATYTGGDVSVGTSVNSLTGITVTATYSDGSTQEVTGYTLSGTIGVGANTITVSYEGLRTTFVVIGTEIDYGEALYPLVNGVFNPSNIANLSVEVTNGNHVKITSTRDADYNARYINFLDVTKNSAYLDVNGCNNQAEVFKLSEGDNVVFTISNFVVPRPSVGFSCGWRVANTNTAISELTNSGVSFPDDIKEVTLAKDYSVGSIFLYGTAFANKTLEFDVSLIVNNQRYI